MKPNRFRGFDHMSFAAMEREEQRLALDCFRTGNMAQGEIHFENAIIFARCDGAEQAEKTLSNL